MATRPASGKNARSEDSKTSKMLAKRTAEAMSSEIKAKRDIFIDALVRGFPKYQAAMMAGYARNTAHKQGSEMWREPYVQEQYRKLRDAIEEEQIVCRKDVIIGLVSEARNDGPGSLQSARVSAWGQVAKVMGYEAPTNHNVNLSGGVMMVPMSQNLDQWESEAATEQQRLKSDVRS